MSLPGTPGEFDPPPDLSSGYRVAAAILGFLFMLSSPFFFLLSVARSDSTFVALLVGALFMLMGFLFLYIGATGVQRSWATKVIDVIASLLFWTWIS